MKLWTTLVLAVLAVAAWFGAQHFIRHEPEPPELRPALVSDDILATFEELECTLFSGHIMKVVREPGGRYRMSFGRDRMGNAFIFEDAVDAKMVQRLLEAVEQSWREPMGGDADEDNLLRLNLKPPKYRLVVRGKAGASEIHFGAVDPSAEGYIMAYEVGGPSVFRTGRQVPNLLEMNVDQWREQKAFLLQAPTITAVQILARTDLEDRDAPEKTLLLERGNRDQWTVMDDTGVSTRADPNKARGLIQRLTSLRVDSFKGQFEDNPDLARITGFPDHSQGTVVLQSGPNTVEVMDIGFAFGPPDVGVRNLQRNEKMVFTVLREDLERALFTTADDLRWRRLAPVFESTLVRVEVRDPDGTKQLQVERANRHPRGNWGMLSPLEGVGVHEGQGDDSWPQVVANLDRLEIDSFRLDEGTFEPQRVVEVQWQSGAIQRDLTLEIAPDGDEGTWVRASDRPGELLRVGPELWAFANQRFERYRDHALFPNGGETRSDVRRLRIRHDAGGFDVTLAKERQLAAFEMVGVARAPSVGQLTSAVDFLYSANAERLHPMDAVDAGMDKPRVEVEVTEEDGTLRTVRVGSDTPGDGVYVTISPDFDGWVAEVPAVRLVDLLGLEAPPSD